MKLEEMIRILENRILTLQQQKVMFENIGDLEKIFQTEQEIQDTIVSLNKLKS